MSAASQLTLHQIKAVIPPFVFQNGEFPENVENLKARRNLESIPNQAIKTKIPPVNSNELKSLARYYALPLINATNGLVMKNLSGVYFKNLQIALNVANPVDFKRLTDEIDRFLSFEFSSKEEKTVRRDFTLEQLETIRKSFRKQIETLREGLKAIAAGKVTAKNKDDLENFIGSAFFELLTTDREYEEYSRNEGTYSGLKKIQVLNENAIGAYGHALHMFYFGIKTKEGMINWLREQGEIE